LVYFPRFGILDQEKSGNPAQYISNPTIMSYNASAVKNYNATSSLVRSETKNIFFYLEKRSSLLQRWRCSCKIRSQSYVFWIYNYKWNRAACQPIEKQIYFCQILGHPVALTEQKRWHRVPTSIHT
jgi:hypothetical protein